MTISTNMISNVNMHFSIDVIEVIMLDYDYGFVCIVLGLMHVIST